VAFRHLIYVSDGLLANPAKDDGYAQWDTPAAVHLITVFSHCTVFIQGYLMGRANSLEGFTQSSILDPQQKYVRRIS
jgi:hypothetical protein